MVKPTLDALKTQIDPIHSGGQNGVLQRQLGLAALQMTQPFLRFPNVILYGVEAAIDAAETVQNEIFVIAGHGPYSAARSAPLPSAITEHSAMMAEDRAMALVK
jgi:hypothetical protein